MSAYLAGETNSFGFVLGLAVITVLGVTVWIINRAWMRREARRARSALIEPTYETSPYGDRHDR